MSKNVAYDQPLNICLILSGCEEIFARNAWEIDIMNAETSHVTKISNTIAFYFTDNEH